METDTTSADQRPDGATVWTHIAMTAVSLVMVGAFLFWQVQKGRDASGTPVAEGAVQGSAGTAATVESGLVATTRVVAPRVYIVGSQEGAEALLALIEEINDFRRFEGLRPLDETVEWFDSPEDEAYFWQGINAVSGVPEMTSLSVIDLRWLQEADGTESR